MVKKTEEIHFRIEDIEKKIILKKAKNSKLNLSEYIRTQAIYGVNIYLNYENLDILSLELARIGNNINQIARGINKKIKFGEDVLSDELSSINEEFEVLRNLLNDFTNKVVDMYKDGQILKNAVSKDYRDNKLEQINEGREINERNS
ncbi:plasmid mobilization protein [Thomasclavelia cocleata]|uniref:plasmid mobilization protein n=1 Tax=Thomasclavelia cocleata TaxID=69824 RepID=UPI00272E8D4C|nr:plasmid mobilization relaxosome protein MobC [Thomasclavelia cocleata]